MGGDIEIPLTPAVDKDLLRLAAVYVAARVAAEHPHPLDDGYPRLAGQAIAHEPAVREDLLELLDAIGCPEAAVIAAKDRNTCLKGDAS